MFTILRDLVLFSICLFLFEIPLVLFLFFNHIKFRVTKNDKLIYPVMIVGFVEFIIYLTRITILYLTINEIYIRNNSDYYYTIPFIHYLSNLTHLSSDIIFDILIMIIILSFPIMYSLFKCLKCKIESSIWFIDYDIDRKRELNDSIDKKMSIIFIILIETSLTLIILSLLALNTI